MPRMEGDADSETWQARPWSTMRGMQPRCIPLQRVLDGKGSGGDNRAPLTGAATRGKDMTRGGAVW